MIGTIGGGVVNYEQSWTLGLIIILLFTYLSFYILDRHQIVTVAITKHNKMNAKQGACRIFG